MKLRAPVISWEFYFKCVSLKTVKLATEKVNLGWLGHDVVILTTLLSSDLFFLPLFRLHYVLCFCAIKDEGFAKIVVIC